MDPLFSAALGAWPATESGASGDNAHALPGDALGDAIISAAGPAVAAEGPLPDRAAWVAALEELRAREASKIAGLAHTNRGLRSELRDRRLEHRTGTVAAISRARTQLLVDIARQRMATEVLGLRGALASDAAQQEAKAAMQQPSPSSARRPAPGATTSATPSLLSSTLELPLFRRAELAAAAEELALMARAWEAEHARSGATPLGLEAVYETADYLDSLFAELLRMDEAWDETSRHGSEAVEQLGEQREALLRDVGEAEQLLSKLLLAAGR